MLIKHHLKWTFATALFAVGVILAALAVCARIFPRNFYLPIPATDIRLWVDCYSCGIAHYSEQTVTGPPAQPDPIPSLQPSTFPYYRGFHSTDRSATSRFEFLGLGVDTERQLYAIDYDGPASRNYYWSRRDAWFPHYMLLFPLALFPIMITNRLHNTRRRRYRQIHQLCPTCSYDLRAHTTGEAGDKCPECGTPVPKSPLGTTTSPG